MFSRFVTGLTIIIRSHYRAFLSQLEQSVATVVSAAMIAGLLYYVFADFVRNKLQITDVQVMTTHILTSAVYLAVSWGLCTMVSRARARNRWYKFLAQVGEERPVIGWTIGVAEGGVVLFLYIGLGVVVLRYWWEARITMSVASVIGLGAVATTYFLTPVERQGRAHRWSFVLPERWSRISAMVGWRFMQMFVLRPGSRLALLGALIAVATVWPAVAWNQESLAVLLAFCSSIFLVQVLANQVRADLASLWIELNCGIGHQQFQQCYEVSVLLLSIVLAGINLAVYCLATQFVEVELSGLSYSIIIASSVCILVFPSVMLQIDPRHPWLQVTICGILGFLLLTASMIHPLFIVLLGVIKYYSSRYGKGLLHRLPESV